MAYTRRQIKELIYHWNEEYLHCIANHDVEGKRFAEAKLAFWNAKLKKKKSGRG